MTVTNATAIEEVVLETTLALDTRKWVEFARITTELTPTIDEEEEEEKEEEEIPQSPTMPIPAMPILVVPQFTTEETTTVTTFTSPISSQGWFSLVPTKKRTRGSST